MTSGKMSFRFDENGKLYIDWLHLYIEYELKMFILFYFILFMECGADMPNEVSLYKTRESNHLVEEYMLLANYLVAQHLVVNDRRLALLRNHGKPQQKSLLTVKPRVIN